MITKVNNTESFILASKQIHSDKYDYSESIYLNSRTKILIKCNVHGKFYQNPRKHFTGQGCPDCSSNKSFTRAEFISKLKIQFGNSLDYRYVKFFGMNNKAHIFCKTHGKIIRTAKSILNSEFACTKCSSTSELTKNYFIEKANQKHNYFYDYSNIEDSNFINNKSTIEIICPKHGVFKQRIKNHLSGHGCGKCCASLGEKIIMSKLNQLDIKFVTQYPLLKNEESNRFLKVDFFLPEKNTVIEYDGYQHTYPVPYFGGEKTLNRIQKLDIIKNEHCIKNNINIIRINFDTHNDIIDSIIKGI